MLEENEDNIQFIRKIKKDSTLVNASHGVPEFISAGGYVGFIPVLSLTDTMRGMIRDKVRLGMDYLIYDYVLKDDARATSDSLFWFSYSADSCCFSILNPFIRNMFPIALLPIVFIYNLCA